MKNIYLIVGALFIITNSSIGLIFTPYSTFNWIIADVIIAINAIFLHALIISNFNDGFKVSISFIFPLVGFIEFVCAILMDRTLDNNYFLATIIVLFTIQVFFYIIPLSLKNINQEN